MRTFFVLICSLALACAARGNAEKTHHAHAPQHAATHVGRPAGGKAPAQHLQASPHVIAPAGHPTSSGQHFEQKKGSQHVPTPRGGPTGVAPAVQPQRETPVSATTAAQPVAPALTQKQLDEAYAQSQGFRSAEQYRKWKETGRVEIPAGVATSKTPTAGGGPGSVQKAEHGITASAIRPATNQAKANPFRPQHFNLPSKPTLEIVGATFQQNRRISESDRWVGSNYQVFRNYRCEWHDRDWWRHHHSRIAFVLGGWYYWNARHWFPAWGYDSTAYYAYDGPIYAYNDLPPDQAIANVQAALQALGYYHGPINGILGPLTRVAIADYQRDHGLYSTSAIDEQTLASLGMV